MKINKSSNSLGISFIIPYRPEENVDQLIKNIKKINKKLKIPFEIIIISGNHPSLQRNIAVKKARKKYLYFIDNDSTINEKSLNLAYNLLNQEKEITILGGPCLLLHPSNYFEKNTQSVLGNKLVVGKIASRYNSLGKKRWTNDLEIILCNLIIRKENFEAIGGFNLNLYPNEENDLVTRILLEKKKVCYHPQFYANKPHRKNLREFIKQMISYGQGRAKQIKANHQKKFNLMVSLALINLLVLFLTIFLLKQFYLLIILKNVAFFYFLYIFFTSGKIISQEKKILTYVPIIIFSCHFFYLFGFFWSLLKIDLKSKKKKKIYNLKVIT